MRSQIRKTLGFLALLFGVVAFSDSAKAQPFNLVPPWPHDFMYEQQEVYETLFEVPYGIDGWVYELNEGLTRNGTGLYSGQSEFGYSFDLRVTMAAKTTPMDVANQVSASDLQAAMDAGYEYAGVIAEMSVDGTAIGVQGLIISQELPPFARHFIVTGVVDHESTLLSPDPVLDSEPLVVGGGAWVPVFGSCWDDACIDEKVAEAEADLQQAFATYQAQYETLEAELAAAVQVHQDILDQAKDTATTHYLEQKQGALGSVAVSLTASTVLTTVALVSVPATGGLSGALLAIGAAFAGFSWSVGDAVVNYDGNVDSETEHYQETVSNAEDAYSISTSQIQQIYNGLFANLDAWYEGQIQSILNELIRAIEEDCVVACVIGWAWIPF